VSDADVLALYRRTADSPDAAASIWATLEAAYRWGLAAVRPVEFRPVLALEEVVPHDDSLFPQRATGAFGLILGLELPEGPHSVLADGGQWFSWGDCWPLSAFGDAVVEEAWAVLWP
jgi:hypothetical protein